MLIFALLFAALIVPPEGIIHVRHGLTKAHACAVRDDIFLTAAHVTDNGGMTLAWSDLVGNEGVAEWVRDDGGRDLSIVRVTQGHPARVWRIATAAPKVGDKVRIVGYDDNKPAAPKIVEARVLDVDAGHIDYDRSPGPGSSGDCVLNAADEVVAINNSFMPGPGDSIRWGTGVSVYGAWAPELPEPESKW